MADSYLSIPQALRRVLGAEQGAGSPYLRQVANSLARNGVLHVVRETSGERRERQAVLLPESELDALHNALLLHAFVDDVSRVKKVFESAMERRQFADLVEAVLGGQQSLVGLAVLSPQAATLAVALRSAADLRGSRLPNPFVLLPQSYLRGDAGLLCAVLARAAALPAADSLLLSYLRGDLEAAHAAAQAIGPVDGELRELRDRVLREYTEAESLDRLLDHLTRR